MNIRELISHSKIIPVLALNDTNNAAELARALYDGGAKSLEITLRTDAAFDVMEVMKNAVPEAFIGAGTVNTRDQIQRCKELELDFMVSPGLHQPLAEAALASEIPYLPGVATASEVLTAIDMGLDTLKFFPAEAAGGIKMLKALAGPYGDIKFCPTGGINSENCHQYLGLDNVLCVGGSWVAPGKLIQAHAWDEIKALTKTVG